MSHAERVWRLIGPFTSANVHAELRKYRENPRYMDFSVSRMDYDELAGGVELLVTFVDREYDLWHQPWDN